MRLMGAEGARHCHTGHTEGHWKERRGGFIFFILSFPLLSPHPYGTGRHKGKLSERVTGRMACS